MGSVPKGTPGYRRQGGMMWERRLAGMRKIFEVADLVTAPSARSSSACRSTARAHAQVVENHVPDQFVIRTRPPRDGVTIGWIAGLEHQLDVERIPIRETLQRLLDERPEVRVVSFGLGLGLRSERYRHVDVVPLIELTREAAAFDVGIAPLSDIAMNRARSNIKLKEYAAAGACWLASPIGPYVGHGEKQGGRLVPDDGWHEALARLLDKPRERAKLTKRAGRWVAGETLSEARRRVGGALRGSDRAGANGRGSLTPHLCTTYQLIERARVGMLAPCGSHSSPDRNPATASTAASGR